METYILKPSTKKLVFDLNLRAMSETCAFKRGHSGYTGSQKSQVQKKKIKITFYEKSFLYLNGKSKLINII